MKTLDDAWLDKAWDIAGELVALNNISRHRLFGYIIAEHLPGAFACAKRAADPGNKEATCATHCGDHERCLSTPSPVAPEPAKTERMLMNGNKPSGVVLVTKPATPAEPVAPGGVPSGWALVPIEPTREMMEASATCRPALKPSDLPLKQAGWSLGAIMDRHRYVAAIGASAKHIGPHTDDIAVDKFAAAMKEKLAEARAKGRGGWETCPPAELARMLRDHVSKGDPRDVANFCMFLWSLGGSTAEQMSRDGGQDIPFSTPVKRWCETCDGVGAIDERLGGFSFSNPAAECPDCNGNGWWTPSAPPAPASEAPTQAGSCQASGEALGYLAQSAVDWLRQCSEGGMVGTTISRTCTEDRPIPIYTTPPAGRTLTEPKPTLYVRCIDGTYREAEPHEL